MLCSFCGVTEGGLKITEENVVRFGCESCTATYVRQRMITLIHETAWDVVMSIPDVNPDDTYPEGSPYEKMQRLIALLGAFDDFESRMESF